MPNELANQLRIEAEELLPEVVALRRHIHAAPELGLDNPATRDAVVEWLADLDLPVTRSEATSGLVFTLTGGRPGPTLLLRADTDALPLQEETGLAFASGTPGQMHACGHDAHTAMLAGAARLLFAHRGELAGTVKFMFQPGEEGVGGARVMLSEGLLESAPAVDAAFAIHVDSTMPVGFIATRPGPLLASADVFSIALKGRGGHASMPHHTLDPIPAACEIATALQVFVARRVDVFDPVVVSVTRIQTGTGPIIINNLR